MSRRGKLKTWGHEFSLSKCLIYNIDTKIRVPYSIYTHTIFRPIDREEMLSLMGNASQSLICHSASFFRPGSPITDIKLYEHEYTNFKAILCIPFFTKQKMKMVLVVVGR